LTKQGFNKKIPPLPYGKNTRIILVSKTNPHMLKSPLFLILFLFSSCQETIGKPGRSAHAGDVPFQQLSIKKIGDISLPAGYDRVQTDKDSFGEWLRNVSLKEDNHVYLYNGQLKRNQGVQFAVLDISVGNKDLQQCADAVMRLRAEYLFSKGRYDEIIFYDNEGKGYHWTKGNDRAAFTSYLETVFNWCGTASLSKQLTAVTHLQNIKPGDVFIKGGFPGHAMIVADVAINKEGKKIYMLAQSYMPAQDIHIVKNLSTDDLDPWYTVVEGEDIDTPEWEFHSDELRTW
jgi:hypothetical protein